MSTCTPVIPPQADADESFLSGGLPSNMAPHRFLLGHVSFAQLPPDHPCFVTTEVVFQATHNWDLEDCQNHNCCFIFQWLWKKATAWIECSKLRLCTICSILFQLCFLLLLRELIFLFNVPPSPQFSCLKLEERKKKKIRAQGVWEEEQRVGISNPMRMWNGWKL